MTRQRSSTFFLFINVIISLGVALAVIAAYTQFQGTEEPTRARPTIVLVVTATDDPNVLLPAAALQGTVDAQAGTVVALERSLVEAETRIQNIPAQSSDTESEGNSTPRSQPTVEANLPTIDPRLIPPLPDLGAGGLSGAAITATPEDGCERYFVQSGDTTSVIASRYEVSLSALLVLNGINDQTILQIGDELLIPSESCEPEVPPTATPLPQPTFNLTLVAPTATLPAIAENSQIEIVQVLNPGDITAEQVEIQNLGGEINLLGWTLADGQGNIYTFPNVRLVPGSVIRVFTRTGTDTPGFLYWNQNAAMWVNGEQATLSNAQGEIQSAIAVGGEVIDFGAGNVATPTRVN